MSQTAAREAARRLYKRVSYSEGPLGNYELSSLMSQTYQFLKIPFKPSQNDIKWYQQILDADRDGKVTLKDLQARAIQYLVNNSVVSTISSSSKSQSYQSSYKATQIQSASKGYGVQETSSYSAYSETSYAQSSAATQPKYNQYSTNDYASSNQYQTGTLPSSKYNQFSQGTDYGAAKGTDYGATKTGDYGATKTGDYGATKAADYGGDYGVSKGDYGAAKGIDYGATKVPDYASKDSEFGASKSVQSAEYSYNYKPSIPSKIQKLDTNQQVFSSSNFGGDTIYSYEKNQSSGRSFNEPSGGVQSSQRSLQYNSYGANQYGANQHSSGNTYSSSNFVNQSIQQQSQPAQQVQYGQYGHQYESNDGGAATYNQNEQYEQRPYSETVQQYLQVVGQVFMRYADQTAYTVTEDDVPDLLRDTYAVLGRQGYNPSKEDVKTWMKLCDINQDGKVEYQEYQYFVVTSLERSGLDLYD